MEWTNNNYTVTIITIGTKHTAFVTSQIQLFIILKNIRWKLLQYTKKFHCSSEKDK